MKGIENMKKESAHRTTGGYEYKGIGIRKETFWADRGIVSWKIYDKETKKYREFSTLKEAKEYIDQITK